MQPFLFWPQELGSALGIVLKRIASSKNIHVDRLHSGPGCLSQDDVDKLILSLQKYLEGPQHVLATLLERQRGPGQLRLASSLNSHTHIIGSLYLDLPDRLQRGGAGQPQATPSARGRINRCYDGHESYSFLWLLPATTIFLIHIHDLDNKNRTCMP